MEARKRKNSTPVEEAAVHVDEDTGDAAGLGGVVGAALGALTAGPVGAAIGAAGGMALGAGTELALHASAHHRQEHVHRWEGGRCTLCDLPRSETETTST